MLTGRGIKADTFKSQVDSGNRIGLLLVDGFMVIITTQFGAEKFLAVQQGNNGIFELHVGHFPAKRQITNI